MNTRVAGGCDDLAAELRAELAGLRASVARDVRVSTLTTYHLGGPIGVLVRVSDRPALAAVARVVAARRPPLLLIGRGSNLLVADAGYAGIGIVLEGDFDTVELGAGDGVVRAGGGVALPVLARRAAAAGQSGLEFYVGIPGSVGGAVRMNAGGHGRETGDVVADAELVDLATAAGGGTAVVRGVRDLAFGYRTSAVGPSEVVTGARFRVDGAPPAVCEERIADIVRWRREHQPGGSNAGSVFTNPAGDSAGRIIDSLGLKGLRVGGAVVSEKHANFFQAEAGASADDVHRLVCEVQRRVRDATGIELRPELRMVGFAEDEHRAPNVGGRAADHGGRS